MEVILAKTAGFCFGVRRAVDTVYEQVEQAEGPIYTYGPIVHNETVVRELEDKGVRVLNSEAELAALTEGTVIIRAHGVGRQFQRKGVPWFQQLHGVLCGRRAQALAHRAVGGLAEIPALGML